ncbi:glycosyltransferase [Siminovitchia sediminis]|uniref:Glycosyltransferase n=1 Tax=Siminovitchia sediminis TaxID=1274353 RepID=A0ABW4KJC9_9BACI
MKKIAFIVFQNFTNDSRVLKQSRTMIDLGHSVSVYAIGDEKLPNYENINGLEVNRIKLKSKSLPKNHIFNLVKYMELAINLTSKIKNNNIIVASSIAPLPIAYLCKLMGLFSPSIIYDARELETESNGLTGLKKKIVNLLEKLLIKKVDAVFTVSSSIKEFYEKKYRKPIYLIKNTPYFIDVMKKNKFREKFKIPPQSKIFLYQGALTKGRGIESIIEYFLVNSQDALIIMGYGPLEKKIKNRIRKSNNIFFQKAVDPAVLMEYTSSADYGFCLIENTCLSYYYCLPNKFFEYSMAGLPVVASDFPELRSYVNKYHNGVLAKGIDIGSIDNAIKQIKKKNYNEMSTNSKKLAMDNDWRNQEDIISKLINEL